MSDTATYRFGVLIRQRRLELGLTQGQVGRQGGPSGPIISTIERAVATTISSDTLAKLDRGLGWEEGSAARTLAGGVPTTDAATTEPPHDASPAGTVAVPVALVATMLRAARTLNTILGGDIDTTTLDAARRELDIIESTLGPICSRYLTHLIENYLITRGGELPADLAAIEHLLDTGVSADDPTAFEDRRYRRWLAGHRADTTGAANARYQARLDTTRTSNAEHKDPAAHAVSVEGDGQPDDT